MRFQRRRDSLVRAALLARLPSQWNCRVCRWPRTDRCAEDPERWFLSLKCLLRRGNSSKIEMQRNFRYWSSSDPPSLGAEMQEAIFSPPDLLETHLRHRHPLEGKSRDCCTDLYLPANYVHEKRNQNEIQIFTKINWCFVSFLRHRCQNRVVSITDNSSDVCVCWWISWEALLLAQAVKRSHLYFNGLRSSGRMWLCATISQRKRESYVAGNLFVSVLSV